MSESTLSLEKALELLREYMAKKQWNKAIDLGEKILKSIPDDAAVTKLLYEARLEYALHKSRLLTHTFRLSFVSILILASFLVYQWFSVFPTFEKTAAEQQTKLINIIKENGNLSQKNEQLQKQINLFQQQVSLLITGLHAVSDKIDRKREVKPDNKEAEIAALQTKIEEQNNQIQQLIQLTVQQEKKKPSTFTYANNIMTFMIVGDHGGLTDTIMLASINPSLKTVSLISVPRDLYIDGRKINEIYKAYGRDTLQVYLADITGLSVKHYVKIDLDGFVKVIDLLGGIDVNVPKDIYDKQYPTGDGGTEELSIPKGWQHFDGTMALKYTRTRHGDSDFERAKRQQQVIEITLDKVKALNLVDVSQQLELVKTALSSVETDVNLFEALGLYEDYKDFTVERGNVVSTSNFLYASKSVNNDYIALPKDATFQEIRQFVYDTVMK